MTLGSELYWGLPPEGCSIGENFRKYMLNGSSLPPTTAVIICGVNSCYNLISLHLGERNILIRGVKTEKECEIYVIYKIQRKFPNKYYT